MSPLSLLHVPSSLNGFSLFLRMTISVDVKLFESNTKPLSKRRSLHKGNAMGLAAITFRY